MFRGKCRSVGVASCLVLGSFAHAKADMTLGLPDSSVTPKAALTPIPSVKDIFNYSPSSLDRWESALQRVLSGRGRARVLFLGDSKDRGAGAGEASSDGMYCNKAEVNAKPARFALMLAQMGIPATHQSWMGSGVLSTTAQIAAYDPRLSFGESWTIGKNSLGGSFIDSDGTDSIAFTPQGKVDSIDVYTKSETGDGIMTVTADGKATILATIDGDGTPGLRKTTVRLDGIGSHTVSIQRVSGGRVSVLGMVAKNSRAPAVDVINAGAIGTMSGYHADLTGPDAPWSSANTLAVNKPDLVFIQLGSNDMNGKVPVEVYKANVQTLIDKAKGAGADVVLEVATFGEEGKFGSQEMRVSYRQALLDLGRRNGTLVVDHASMFGTFAAAQSLGLMRDSIHESARGYLGEARTLVGAVVPNGDQRVFGNAIDPPSSGMVQPAALER